MKSKNTPNTHFLQNPEDEDYKNNNSLFGKLKKLFSTDVIVRNIGGKKLKIADTDEAQLATNRNSLRDRFNRLRSTTNLYHRDMIMSYQSARLELFRDYDCVGPDTIIPLVDGSMPTIAELTEKYKDNQQERFYVYSYDHETDSIKLGKAYHPRKKGKRKSWKVTFDNGQFVIGSAGHPFLMRDGNYKKLQDVSIGESVMPFYQSEYGYKNHNFKRYKRIYNFSKGWQSVHKIVAEQFYHPLTYKEVVHHKNFNASDNSPDNLKIMTSKQHIEFHRNHNKNVLWGSDNYNNQLNKLLNNSNYINRKIHKWNGKRKGKNNPFYGKTHSTLSNFKRSKSLKEIYKDRNFSEENNPNYRNDINLDVLLEKSYEIYKNNGKLTIKSLLKEISCDYSTLYNRLNREGFSWNEFKENVELTLNHKIVSIEYVGEIDVYDVTVEKYQNFATDSCFVHNTMDQDPIIASALDIYSDECTTKNELGWILNINSSDSNIKQILHNLFYDILNIEFNLWSWTRNMCKYGDFFLKLNISPEYGIFNVEPLSAYEVTRIEHSDPDNPDYVKFQHDGVAGGGEYENYEIAHFRLIGDSNYLPYGKCLVGDTKIWTPSGYKELKDFKENDEVLCFDTNQNKLIKSKVLKSIYSGYKPVYKLKTAHREIIATDNHPFLTKNGDYKQLSDLCLNDELILPINNTIVDEIPNLLIEEKLDKKTKIIEESILKDNFSEFCRFFGFMLGDGWLDKSNNTVAFSIGERLDKSQKYIDFIKKLNVNVRLTNEYEKNSSCIINSVYLYKLFEKLNFKTGSLNKVLPQWVWNLSLNNKKELLYGFADADGCDIETNIWQVGTINHQLMIDLRELAIQCGFSVTKLWSTKGESNRMYLFTFRENSRDYKIINENYAVEKIRSITKLGKEDVYDIQVESEFHNFIANGIVVHNSQIENARRIWKQLSLMEDAMLIHRIMRAPEKRIFRIDIGNIPPSEVDNFMEQIITKQKRIPFMDEKTGDYNLRFNLQNMTEDFYIPVRGGDSGTQIETLGGLEWTGIEDIDYLKHKMMSALKIPKAFLGYEEGLSGKCIRGNTEICLLDGRNIKVEELAKLYENETDPNLEVYSYDSKTNSIIPGKIVTCKKTRLNAELVRIHLDNGTYVDTTPDHGFVLKGGKKCEAQNLKPGDSLQSVYRRNKKIANKANDYEQVYQPNTSKWQWTHKMVDEYYNGKLENNGYVNESFDRNSLTVVHHVDFNRYNNSSNNLQRMRFDDHIDLHSKNLSTEWKSWYGKRSKLNKLSINRQKSSNIQKQRIKDNPELAYKLKESWLNKSHEERSIICKKGWLNEEKIQKRIQDNKNMKLAEKMISAYKKKYKNGKFDTTGKLNGKWRGRPSLEFIIEHISNNKHNDINSLSKLSKSLGYHISIIKEVIESNDYTINEFLNYFVGFTKGRPNHIKKEHFEEIISNYESKKSLFNETGISRKGFNSILNYTNLSESDFESSLGSCYNHKVIEVEILNERDDTYNLEVWDENENHNYLINNGIIIKNSTLAAEDVRFARTITRLQYIITSELNKIAIIHLYSQGFRDASLVDFELELTNPSTIFEQEKVALWGDKMNIAREMMDGKMFSKKWIYENIFNIPEDEQTLINEDIVKDAKETYRFSQIESEGNDPKSSLQGISAGGDITDLDDDMVGDSEGEADVEDAGDELSDLPEPAGGDELPDLSEPEGDTGEPLTEESDISEEHHGHSNTREETKQREIDAKRKRHTLNTRGTTEDPLGYKELTSKEGSKSDLFSPKPRKQSFGRLPYLENFAKKLIDNKKSSLISETKKPTSMLDENNILSDDE